MHSKIQPTCTPRVRNSFDSSTLHNTGHHRSASVPINHQMLLKNQIHLCAHPWHYEQTMERAAFGALRIVFQGPSISTYSGELVNPKARRRCSQALGMAFHLGDFASAVGGGASEARCAGSQTPIAASRIMISRCDTQNPCKHPSPSLSFVAHLVTNSPWRSPMCRPRL